MIKRDSSQCWATAIPTEEGDTFHSLAYLIHLDYAERDKWIKGGVTLEENARVGCEYKIPNVMAFYTSKPYFRDRLALAFVKYCRSQVMRNAILYEQQGYKVLRMFEVSDMDVFIKLWNEDGLYGVAYGGHGRAGGLCVAPTNDANDTIYPACITPKYKIAVGMFYACESNYNLEKNKDLKPNGYWRDHVALDFGGFFLGYDESAWWFPLPWTASTPTIIFGRGQNDKEKL